MNFVYEYTEIVVSALATMLYVHLLGNFYEANGGCISPLVDVFSLIVVNAKLEKMPVDILALLFLVSCPPAPK